VRPRHFCWRMSRLRSACAALREAEALLQKCIDSSSGDLLSKPKEATSAEEDEVLSKMGKDAVDVEKKQFGPKADVGELLQSVRTSLQILEIAEGAFRGHLEEEETIVAEPEFEEEPTPTPQAQKKKKKKSTFPI